MQTNSEMRRTNAEKANEELVLRFYTEADQKIRDDLISPDFVGRAPGSPPFDRDGFILSLSAFLAAFPDGRYVNEDSVTEGDKVVTVGSFRGTHNGEFRGIPPTGKHVTIMVVHVDRVSGGKIVEHLRVSDTGDLMRQIRPDSAVKP